MLWLIIITLFGWKAHYPQQLPGNHEGHPIPLLFITSCASNTFKFPAIGRLGPPCSPLLKTQAAVHGVDHNFASAAMHAAVDISSAAL